jgi:hypothetical protein
MKAWLTRGNSKEVPDLLPLGTIVEVVKIDKHGSLWDGVSEVGMKRQPGFSLQGHFQGVSQFNK